MSGPTVLVLEDKVSALRLRYQALDYLGVEPVHVPPMYNVPVMPSLVSGVASSHAGGHRPAVAPHQQQEQPRHEVQPQPGGSTKRNDAAGWSQEEKDLLEKLIADEAMRKQGFAVANEKMLVTPPRQRLQTQFSSPIEKTAAAPTPFAAPIDTPAAAPCAVPPASVPVEETAVRLPTATVQRPAITSAGVGIAPPKLTSLPLTRVEAAVEPRSVKTKKAPQSRTSAEDPDALLFSKADVPLSIDEQLQLLRLAEDAYRNISTEKRHASRVAKQYPNIVRAGPRSVSGAMEVLTERAHVLRERNARAE